MGKIMSVDDQRMVRSVIRGAAEMLGYDFIEAENGRVALELLEKHYEEVDLIVLDVNMPEMNGLECLDEIMTDARFKTIPVMMVTTESERQTIVNAIKTGAANYVCKPFTQEELTTKMVESLGHGLGM